MRAADEAGVDVDIVKYMLKAERPDRATLESSVARIRPGFKTMPSARMPGRPLTLRVDLFQVLDQLGLRVQGCRLRRKRSDPTELVAKPPVPVGDVRPDPRHPEICSSIVGGEER